ncbi:hypothetical protein [[Leptolyngbya] sp. PCC 7376]|uniref:hypothetical protein n=1 Tax=[Leptolyngbya] sp. PCC 7376 TaxID=111781 RepID=UPI0005A2CC9E|nr:hypothetical protein [[Leptolyngbya] sp. PCC 7376]
MPTYKCRSCGNEYKQETPPSKCEVTPHCKNAVFFVDLSSHGQLLTLNIQLESKNNDLGSINSDLMNQNKILSEDNKHLRNQTRTQRKKSVYKNKSLFLSTRNINIFNSVLLFISFSVCGGGYWGYTKYQELKFSSQSLAANLRSTRQSLNSRIEELESDKSLLLSQIKELESDKSFLEERKESLKNKVDTIDDNYVDILKNNHNLNVIREGWNTSWENSLSPNDSSDALSTFIIPEDSYLDITLYNLAEGADADFELYHHRGEKVENSRQETEGGDELDNFFVESGSYYVKVWLYGNKSTSFTLKVSRR